MPYTKKKVEPDVLAFISPARSCTLVYKSRDIAPAECRNNTSTRLGATSGDDLPWKLPENFVDEYLAGSQAKKRSMLNRRLDAILNHVERLSKSWVESNPANPRTAAGTLANSWLDLLELSRCGPAVEQECLCVLLHSLSNVDLNIGFIDNEVKLIKVFVKWLTALAPLCWVTSIPEDNILLRSKVIQAVCRRLDCRHFLGHISDGHCHELMGHLRTVTQVIDRPLDQHGLYPILLRLAVGHLEETLRVASIHTYGELLAIEPFLFHTLMCWHESKMSSARSGFDAELRKAVAWSYTLCMDSAPRKSSWLQEKLALEIMGELAVSSTDALQLLMFAAAARLPDFARRKLTEGSRFWLGESSLQHDASVFYWSWQHTATYVQALRRVSQHTSSPERRLLAFAGRMPGAAAAYVKTDASSRKTGKDLGYGDGSLVGLAHCSTWGRNPCNIKLLLRHEFGEIATQAEGQVRKLPAGGLKVDTLGSCVSLLKPCREALRKLRLDPAASTVTPATSDTCVLGRATRWNLTERADSTASAILADCLSRVPLPALVPWDSPSSSAGSTPSFSTATTATTATGSTDTACDRPSDTDVSGHTLESIREHNAGSCVGDNTHLRATKQQPAAGHSRRTDVPKPFQKKKLSEKVTTRQADVHHTAPQSHYIQDQEEALKSLALRQWWSDVAAVVHAIEIETVDEETTLAPYPSLTSSAMKMR